MPELFKGSYSEPVSPLVLFKSDQVKMKAIDLAEVLQIFSQKILPEIIKKASNERLYLNDDPFEDIDLTEKTLEVLTQIRRSN